MCKVLTLSQDGAVSGDGYGRKVLTLSQDGAVSRDGYGCKVLTLSLSQDGAVSGDGYGVEGSPHTEHESFAGLGLQRAAEVRQRQPIWVVSK